jgi:2-haloacid dehalogenase
MKGSPIAAVVFDVGGVLIDWDPRHLYRRLFTGDEAGMEAFLATVCTPEWNHAQDLGRPWAEAVAERTALFPEHSAMIEAYAARWGDMVAGAHDGTVAILRSLKARGMPLYALTNFSKETLALVTGRFDFFAAFEGIVVSGAEGVAKPDPRVFRILFERYALDPATCLFIDDLPANVATARALGMPAVLFTSPGALVDELRLHGIGCGVDRKASGSVE